MSLKSILFACSAVASLVAFAAPAQAAPYYRCGYDWCYDDQYEETRELNLLQLENPGAGEDAVPGYDDRDDYDDGDDNDDGYGGYGRDRRGWGDRYGDDDRGWSGRGRYDDGADDDAYDRGSRYGDDGDDYDDDGDNGYGDDGD